MQLKVDPGNHQKNFQKKLRLVCSEKIQEVLKAQQTGFRDDHLIANRVNGCRTVEEGLFERLSGACFRVDDRGEL